LELVACAAFACFKEQYNFSYFCIPGHQVPFITYVSAIHAVVRCPVMGRRGLSLAEKLNWHLTIHDRIIRLATIGHLTA